MATEQSLRDEMISDPVVRVALRQIHSFVNANNMLAQDEDKDYTRAALKLLHRGGHRLVPDELVAWALANDWESVAAKRVREFAERVLQGRSFVYRSGLHRGFTEQTPAAWRNAAAAESPH
jgi:hypothetical protein